MRMVMGIEPAEPHPLLNPTPLGHMHAEMEILVEEVIEAESRHSPNENIYMEKILNPKHHRRMQTENQRCIPPSESDFLAILILREKIGWASTKDAVVDQGVGAKRIRPYGLVHHKPMQKPFEKAGVEKKRDKAYGLWQVKYHLP